MEAMAVMERCGRNKNDEMHLTLPESRTLETKREKQKTRLKCRSAANLHRKGENMYQMTTDYLDASAARFPDKLAFNDDKTSLTFGELQTQAKSIASCLTGKGFFRQPVAVFMDKSTGCIPAMMGIVYSGCFYTVLDVHMPAARIQIILNTLQPAAILTDQAHAEEAAALIGADRVIQTEDAGKTPVDEEALARVHDQITWADTLYVLFTSGSTGVPKGVTISHGANIHYLEWLAADFKIDETTVFANQTPFYFVMSGLDIYMTMYAGATCHIIPSWAYSFPVMLLNWLNQHKVNTLYWVPSILCLVANFRALPEVHIENLRMVIFGGEVMPSKQLNMWRKEYPDTVFGNLYGPTEMTDVVAYYIIDRPLDDKESLPIGKACSHMRLMILDENGKEVAPGEVGELCGSGPSLADGYYHAPEKTAEVFVTNPLYQEGEPDCFRRMYKTGDLVRIDERGDLIYMGRKDFQIKHMGNRIELGEIETAVSAVDGVERNCCLYDQKHSRIVLFYTGKAEENELLDKVAQAVPEYMVPNDVRHLDAMPLNLNGKIDRSLLKQEI